MSDEKNLETRHDQECVIQDSKEEIDGLSAELDHKVKTMARISENLENMAARLEEQDQMIEDMKLGGRESEPWVRWSTWAAQDGL